MDRAAPAIDDERKAEFGRAIESVNQWRGRMIENFARVEQAVGEALLASNVREADCVKVQRLVGQRFEMLADRLSASPKPMADSEACALALTKVRERQPVRHALCHGTTRVSLEHSGEWVAVMELLAFRAGLPERSTFVFRQGDAKRLLKDVKADGDRLCAALQRLYSPNAKNCGPNLQVVGATFAA